MKAVRLNLFLLIFITTASVYASAPEISIVYPEKEQTIGAVDSNFIFGSVTPGSELTINEHSISVHEQGGFLAYLPLEPGVFEYIITAVLEGDTTELIWPVNVPTPRRTLSYDALRIAAHEESARYLSLRQGDLLRFSFRGTPGCIAWARIPGIIDSIPMAEKIPQVQPFWGRSVFGAGAVPDSVKIKGVYSGFYEIGPEESGDSVRMEYFLKAPNIDYLTEYLKLRESHNIDFDILNLLRFEGERVAIRSRTYLELNSDQFPRTVQLTDSVQRVRVGPGKGYLSIFQPRGVKVVATGESDNWYRLKLSESVFGWIAKSSVKVMPKGILPERSYLRSLRVFNEPENARIEIPLTDRHMYRIEETGDKKLSLFLYGVMSDTDWIRYDSNDPDIGYLQWAQPEKGLYRLDIELKRPLWGYDVSYEGTVLYLDIIRPPEKVKSLKDKIIVVDPGHSPDRGAVGPTGLTEREVNLAISKQLAEKLLDKGARVIMTRMDGSPVSLYERPVIAKTANADLFVSVHNNALPDGVNPFENNGTSVYYYHRHSFNLGRYVYEELLEKTELPRHGLYHGNLAVNRPTQYPAILVECAFMMIPEQEDMLRDSDFQEDIAEGITKGIEEFLEDYERRTED